MAASPGPPPKASMVRSSLTLRHPQSPWGPDSWSLKAPNHLRKGRGMWPDAPAPREFTLGQAMRQYGATLTLNGTRLSVVAKYITAITDVPENVSFRVKQLLLSNNSLRCLGSLSKFQVSMFFCYSAYCGPVIGASGHSVDGAMPVSWQ